MKELLDALAGLVSSPFVALVLALLGIIFLYRLYLDERDKNREDNQKQWGIVSDLSGGLKDNTAITSRALDTVERSGR